MLANVREQKMWKINNQTIYVSENVTKIAICQLVPFRWCFFHSLNPLILRNKLAIIELRRFTVFGRCGRDLFGRIGDLLLSHLHVHNLNSHNFSVSYLEKAIQFSD